MAARLNLLVIRSVDIDAAARFYAVVGLHFNRHTHGSGPEHYASEDSEVVFEIYPRTTGQVPTAATRIGFSVDSVDELTTRLLSAGGRLVCSPNDSPWGRRAVVEDPDGHRIELVSPTPDRR